MSDVIKINLPLVKLEIGMKIADVVKDRSGRVLLAEDSVLTAKYLKVFKMWGVNNVHVYVDGDVAVQYAKQHAQATAATGAGVEYDAAVKYCEQKFGLSNLEFDPTTKLKQIIINRIVAGKQAMPKQ